MTSEGRPGYLYLQIEAARGVGSLGLMPIRHPGRQFRAARLQTPSTWSFRADSRHVPALCGQSWRLLAVRPGLSPQLDPLGGSLALVSLGMISLAREAETEQHQRLRVCRCSSNGHIQR